MKTAGKKKSGLGLPPEARWYEQVQTRVWKQPGSAHGEARATGAVCCQTSEARGSSNGGSCSSGTDGLMGSDPRIRSTKGLPVLTYAYAAIVHQVWAAVKVHCVANKRAHATREWVLFFRHWETGPAEARGQAEIRESLWEMVLRLPERMRVVIVAYRCNGKSSEMGRLCLERLTED